MKKQNWDNNEIITIKFRDMEFEIDIIGDQLLIDPTLKGQFRDKRGLISKKTFDKQPLIKFLKRLTTIWHKQNSFQSFDMYLKEQEKLK